MLETSALPSGLFIGVLVVQRLSELLIARRNTARLMARGAREIGARHYPAMVALHASWLLAIALLGWGEPVLWPWLAPYVVLQGLRVWILTTLGSRWTTRIIVLDEPLVARGPYRYVNHPNYWLVVAEIVVAPMVLGLWSVAIVWSVLNALMLWWRIGVENEALGLGRSPRPARTP